MGVTKGVLDKQSLLWRYMLPCRLLLCFSWWVKDPGSFRVQGLGFRV